MCHRYDNTYDDGLEVCIDKDFTTEEDTFESQAHGVSYEELPYLFFKEYVCNEASGNDSDIATFGLLTGICDRAICSAKFKSTNVDTTKSGLVNHTILFYFNIHFPILSFSFGFNSFTITL